MQFPTFQDTNHAHVKIHLSIQFKFTESHNLYLMYACIRLDRFWRWTCTCLVKDSRARWGFHANKEVMRQQILIYSAKIENLEIYSEIRLSFYTHWEWDEIHHSNLPSPNNCHNLWKKNKVFTHTRHTCFHAKPRKKGMEPKWDSCSLTVFWRAGWKSKAWTHYFLRLIERTKVCYGHSKERKTSNPGPNSIYSEICLCKVELKIWSTLLPLCHVT